MTDGYDGFFIYADENIFDYYPIAESFSKISSEAVIFEQVDFIFSETKIKDSEWGRLTVNPKILTKISETPRGFLNVYTDNGWVVKNFYINQKDGLDSVTTYFDLGVSEHTDVKSISAKIEFSPMPKTKFVDGDRFDFSVGTKIWSATGAGDVSSKGLDSPLIPPSSSLPKSRVTPPITNPVTPPITLTSLSSTHTNSLLLDSNPEIMTIQTTSELTDSGVFWTLSNISNIETALNQCVSMAIANSLQYLKDSFGINIPHDHIEGLRGDATLVGQLDDGMNREVHSRTSGAGVWFNEMFDGKFSYLQTNGLQDDLINKHWGVGYGVELPRSDYTSYGITSEYKGPVDFDRLCYDIKTGSDVELIYTYSDTGHAVRVFECGEVLGDDYLGFVHDSNQLDDADGLENVRLRVFSSNGNLYLGTTAWEIVFVLSESVPPQIPSWIKNNAGWWAEGAIDDDSFVQGLEFLVKEQIIRIPPLILDEGTPSEIPDYVKITAGLWAAGSLTDWDFIFQIQWLIENGMIDL